MPQMRDRRRSARLEREQEALEAKRARWHPPTVMAWMCVVTSTTLLLGLSMWQFIRLDWKEGLIADINANQYSRAYGTLPEDIELIHRDMSFARVRLKGKFLHQDELHLAARYYHSQLGYHILTPFKLDDGRVVLLNRGWVHADMKEPETRMEGQVEGYQSVIAMVRLDNDRNAFTPDHDTEKNIWFWRDLDTASFITGYELFPVNLDVLYSAPPGERPIPSNGLVALRNDHLGYALTWLLIAISGLIIFFKYHHHAPKIEEEEA